MTAIEELAGVSAGRGPKPAIEGVSLALAPGDFVCIYGRSGAGKTSLLRVAALVDKPLTGKVYFEGRDLTTAPASLRARLRLERIGYIPQHQGLIEELTALENIMLPLLAQGLPRAEARRRALEAAEPLGIKGLLGRLPRQLSGGERQRVAIARALAKGPRLVVADEPLQGLDEELSETVKRLLERQARGGAAVLYATPDPTEDPPCTRAYRLAKAGLEPV